MSVKGAHTRKQLHDLCEYSKYGYNYQYVRNTLQVNNGLGPLGHPTFSEVSQLSGVHATDWSWSPLLADFDHDEDRDLLITNGFPKDYHRSWTLAYIVNRIADT